MVHHITMPFQFEAALLVYRSINHATILMRTYPCFNARSRLEIRDPAASSKTDPAESEDSEWKLSLSQALANSLKKHFNREAD